MPADRSAGNPQLAGLIAPLHNRCNSCNSDDDQEERPPSQSCRGRSKPLWRGIAYFVNFSLITIHFSLVLVICSTFVAARPVPQSAGIAEALNLMDGRQRDKGFGYPEAEAPASYDRPSPSSLFSTWFRSFSSSVNMSMQRAGRHEKMKQQNGFNPSTEIVDRRRLNGPGSSPPSCKSKCGKCIPCKPVHVPIQPGKNRALEYYPEAWRCKCGNKLYMP